MPSSPPPPRSPAEASAPASSANLGSGFDCVAVALDIRCTVRAEPAPAWSVEHRGAHAPLPGADDAVRIAAEKAVGGDRPLRLEVDNAIPIGRGLGSSSAAFAAGALAAWRAVGEETSPDRLFRLVDELEGHPDNAAAAVYGGLVLAGPGGEAHRLPWNSRYRVVVAVPDEPFSTHAARGLLPASYPADVVTRSLARAAALVAGLLLGDDAVLAAAGGDEIHERWRESARPDVSALVARASAAGAAHAAWSGAGPSVIALVTSAGLPAVVASLTEALGGSGAVLTPAVAGVGAA